MQAVVLLDPNELSALCGALVPAGQTPSVELTLRWLESSNCTEVGSSCCAEHWTVVQSRAARLHHACCIANHSLLAASRG